jgi:hypothetical protein
MIAVYVGGAAAALAAVLTKGQTRSFVLGLVSGVLFGYLAPRPQVIRWKRSKQSWGSETSSGWRSSGRLR